MSIIVAKKRMKIYGKTILQTYLQTVINFAQNNNFTNVELYLLKVIHYKILNFSKFDIIINMSFWNSFLTYISFKSKNTFIKFYNPNFSLFPHLSSLELLD